MIGLCQKCWSSGVEVTVKEGVTICKKCDMLNNLNWTDEDEQRVVEFREKIKEGKLRLIDMEDFLNVESGEESL